MPIMISIPDDCKPLADAVKQLVASVDRAHHRARGGRAVDYAQIERDVSERTAAVERAAHQSILAALDVDAPTVVIDGRVHTRVHRAEGRYYTLAGDVVVPRALYRAARNGPVVDAMSLRAGAVAGGWLPETATAIAHLLQQGTPREAEDTAQRLRRLPYSRSSFDRVGHAVGQLYAAKKTAIDDTLIVALEIPPPARSVSFGIDRVSLPMEEPRPRPVGRTGRPAVGWRAGDAHAAAERARRIHARHDGVRIARLLASVGETRRGHAGPLRRRGSDTTSSRRVAAEASCCRRA
ncbi:MAG TPA: hypothetical protein VGJ78_17025 [Vicinamibacterales bacterium]